MDLREFVSRYDGDILFSVKETVTDCESSKNVTIISFKNGEHEALRENLLAREVKNFHVEIIAKSSGVTKTYDCVVVIILAEEAAEEETA